MNVVDSSGWLEYFAGGWHARTFEPALEDLESLIVPAVLVYEVFKVLLREAGEEPAIQGVAAMQRGRIIDLTVQRALDAAAAGADWPRPRVDSAPCRFGIEAGGQRLEQGQDRPEPKCQ